MAENMACIRCAGPRGDSSHHSYCRPCFQVYSRERYWRLRPREQRDCEICGADITHLNRRARCCSKPCAVKYQNSKKTSARIRASDLKRHYGITVAEFEQILAVQGGGCAICGRDGSTSPGGILHVDHCHQGGHVRGLLCANCNRAIGQLGDDAARLRRAADYLEGKT